MHEVYVAVSAQDKVQCETIWSLILPLTLLPFRWKQHEAYVQVLETKYADLCCKYIYCFVIGPKENCGTVGCLLWCTALFYTRHRLSQRHDGVEGVGWEAQAAAAGVCPQRKHPGHETCHQGAGNARVHSMYLILLFLHALGAPCASASRVILLASRVKGFSQLSLHVRDPPRY